MALWHVPGASRLADLALEAFPKGARVLDLSGTPATAAALAQRGGLDAQPVPAESLPELPVEAGSVAGIVAPFPTRHAPLIPLLHACHDALAEDGHLALCDLVWQTAPTPELLQAFAPTPGRERVRPIEGYEMQAEHAGFDLVRRIDLAPEDWVDHYAGTSQAVALAADTRGAARLSLWLLRKA